VDFSWQPRRTCFSHRAMDEMVKKLKINYICSVISRLFNECLPICLLFFQGQGRVKYNVHYKKNWDLNFKDGASPAMD